MTDDENNASATFPYDAGWFRARRAVWHALRGHPIDLQVWLELEDRARYSSDGASVTKDGRIVDLRIGQAVFGEPELAKLINAPRRTVRDAVERLARLGVITLDRTPRGSIATIVGFVDTDTRRDRPAPPVASRRAGEAIGAADPRTDHPDTPGLQRPQDVSPSSVRGTSKVHTSTQQLSDASNPERRQPNSAPRSSGSNSSPNSGPTTPQHLANTNKTERRDLPEVSLDQASPSFSEPDRRMAVRAERTGISRGRQDDPEPDPNVDWPGWQAWEYRERQRAAYGRARDARAVR